VVTGDGAAGDGVGAEIRIEVVGEVGEEEAERLHRQLRDELEAGGVESSLLHEDPAAGSKSAVGVVTGVVVPLVSAVTPVISTTLSVWLTQRRGRCTLRLSGPGGSAIELPAVELNELDDVLRRWRAAAGDDQGA
jgi:hypothetical protein